MRWSAQDALNAVLVRVVMPALRDHLDRVWQESGERQTWVEHLQQRAAGSSLASGFIASDVRLQLDLLATPELAPRFGLDEGGVARAAEVRRLVDDLAGSGPAAVATGAATAE